MSKSSAFHFKHFSIAQEDCAMKVGIDSVLLGAWAPTADADHLLDIGTGTGVLALMLAQRSNATIDAVEIEELAYKQAKRNIEDSPFHDRIKIHHSSIQDFTPGHRYTHIISNPPYFSDSLKAETKARTTARHTDQLSFEELFSRVASWLVNEGIFSLILPHSELDKITAIAKVHQMHLRSQSNVAGKEGKQPNRILLSFDFKESAPLISHINVRNEEGKYSDEFQQLTQDFYLDSIFR